MLQSMRCCECLQHLRTRVLPPGAVSFVNSKSARIDTVCLCIRTTCTHVSATSGMSHWR
eukprot:m.726560 g.726560  ORF g.726560 m.726560 type:complete len:59 (-) comp23029_c0_seq27:31-207(-)